MAVRANASSVRALAQRARRRVRRSGSREPAPLPLVGFDEHRTHARYLELLDDDDLAALNALLPWQAYTVDAKGRRFGDRASTTKRASPQVIPDPRIVAMHERFDLRGKHVLEVGCFEGVHTIGLCQLGARVTAVDVRIANVVKTIVRCAFYDVHPTVLVCNLETWGDDESLGADLVHDVGVLYHLRDPVSHLLRLGRLARIGVMLDTHVADDDDATEAMVVAGETYRYKRVVEYPDPEHAFAGAFDHAKWLRLDDILALLRHSGFEPTVAERRAERNGQRVLVMAERA